MALLVKIEQQCTDCNNRFIVAVKPSDVKALTCCPFCGAALDYSPESDEEE